MNWLTTSIYWYAALLVLGLGSIPITKKLFGKVFYDFGYPFAKVLAIIFLSYLVFILGMIKILPFTQTSLFFTVILFFTVNFLFARTTDKTKKTKIPYLIIFEELLFFASFIFWVFIRGQEPSIRGLEKFMDFGFINSLLRSKFFPPLDMWLSADSFNKSGYFINYYYFGHLTGAFLIKLTGIKPAFGYNLILATIFAFGITQVFSLVFNICHQYLVHVMKKKKLNNVSVLKLTFFGLIGSFIVNLGGNLHTIYVFTKGYPNDKPIPFWQILGKYNPLKYWYPNATRFIPFTIHEFPSYSYVVADLHGHVFDIPFVLLTLAVVFVFFLKAKKNPANPLVSGNSLLITLFLGFMTAVHYMTNAFDGPIYLLMIALVFLIVFRLTKTFFLQILILISSFLIYSLPFSLNFSPFASGIGVNCSHDWLVKIGRIGPFLFEKNNCQVSPPWMLFVLWGFFWVNFILFILINRKAVSNKISSFIFILFSLGTFLIIIPEFFYVKDIYPAHFRANTMFKLGYQAFIMMGIASSFVFFQIKFLPKLKRFVFNLIFTFFFFFVAVYPFFSIPSYYGALKSTPNLDGETWFKSYYPEDQEIIRFFNTKISGQPTILEAQGDSYTDYERISAYTGLPTVAGWWVHEWLWRGSPDVIGKRIPDVVNIYQSEDIDLTRKLIKNYQIKYIVISRLEREKYPNINYKKFSALGKVIFHSQNNSGVIYQVNQ